MIRRLTFIILTLLAPLPEAQGQVIMDHGYAHRPTAQRDQATRHINNLLAPTLTCPALAQAGGELLVRTRPPTAPWKPTVSRAKETGAAAAHGWRAYIRRRGSGPVISLRLLRARRGGRELVFEVPHFLARDVYDLRVMGLGVDETQANAVRVLGAGSPKREGFRFAVITDHQLWDPSYRLTGRELNAGGIPANDGAERNMSMVHQEMHELSLHDPDFILLPGDLVYGVDYPREYGQARALLRRWRLPIFAVPGNHDAYADYVVKLRGGALTLVAGALECRKHLEGELTWGKTWVFATCLYGDIKQLLYADLHRDGLTYWSRQLGPPTYAFSHGGLRLVGINTYDGTPERRHAFSLFMDALDLKLGVPAVDNYGGYLTDKQLAFIRAEAAGADRRGETLVLFGHHDPRGNAQGRPYHPNEAFPTDPLSMGGFEEWNYDSAKWDSDPGDGRAVETPMRHSGMELLKILARHGGYYLCGHVHRDQRTIYKKGDRLRGITVRKRLEFIRTTTAAAGATGDGYWGYRIIKAAGGRLTGVDYDPGHELGSVPAGNLWARPAAGSAPPEVNLASGLPRATRVMVSMSLPRLDQGYRFRLRPGTETAGAPDPKEAEPRVRQLVREGEEMTFWVAVTLPAAGFPPTPKGRVRRVLRALPARGNRAPRPMIHAAVSSGAALAPLDRPLEAHTGQTILLSAEGSTDPEGDRILTYRWDLGGHGATGPRVAHTFTRSGRITVRLTLEDEAGARSNLVRQLLLTPPAMPGCGGCCTERGAETSGAALLGLLGLLGAVGCGILRRRRRGR